MYIGLLSGTSVDGIDAALWDFSCGVRLVDTLSYPLDPAIKDTILKLINNPNCSLIELGRLDKQLGVLFAKAAEALIDQSGVQGQVKAIGCHGQTLWHQPNDGPDSRFTMQIGDPNTIAQRTGLPVVADFRRADVALGGQGAPLVPAFHQAVFKNDSSDRIIINIGGITNITVLKRSEPAFGYDTGPGNALLDGWIQRHKGVAFDKDGQWASSGTCCPTLLTKMLEHPFFSTPYPKSTGKETFNLTWLDGLATDLAPEDVQATLVELTVRALCDEIEKHMDHGELFVCGGGAHNQALMARLQALSPFCVADTGALGISPDWVESGCFAWLAKLRLDGQLVEIAQTTGSVKNTLLGGIYQGVA